MGIDLKSCLLYHIKRQLYKIHLVTFLDRKLSAQGVIKDFITFINTHFDTTVKCFKANNGEEYVENNLEAWVAQQGTIHE